MSNKRGVDHHKPIKTKTKSKDNNQRDIKEDKEELRDNNHQQPQQQQQQQEIIDIRGEEELLSSSSSSDSGGWGGRRIRWWNRDFIKMKENNNNNSSKSKLLNDQQQPVSSSSHTYTFAPLPTTSSLSYISSNTSVSTNSSPSSLPFTKANQNNSNGNSSHDHHRSFKKTPSKQTNRYQKLNEVDPSLYDSDDDDRFLNNDLYGDQSHVSNTDQKYNLHSVIGFFTYIYQFLRYTLLGDFKVAIRYVHKNSKKNIKSLVLGLLTVFLVVLFISFLQNLIQASPIVFLKLSEDQAGELDLILTGDPSAMMGGSSNQTLVSTSRISSYMPPTTYGTSKGPKNSMTSAQYIDYNELGTTNMGTATEAEEDLVIVSDGKQKKKKKSKKLVRGKLVDDSPADQINWSPTELLRMLSKFDVSSFFVNSTYLTQSLAGAKTVHGVAPRWMSLGDIQSPQTQMTSSLILLVMNTTLEASLGLGRGWTLPPLKNNQTYVSNAFLRRIQVPPNENAVVNMHVDFVDVLERLGASSIPSRSDIEQMIIDVIGQPIPQFINITTELQLLNFTNPSLTAQLVSILGDALTTSNGDLLLPEKLLDNIYYALRGLLVIDRDLVVAGGIDSPGGKYPSMLGNVAVLESSFVNDIIRERLSNVSSYLSHNLSAVEQLIQLAAPFIAPSVNITQILGVIDNAVARFQHLASTFSLNDYSMSPVIMLQDRVKIYTSSEDSMKASMIAFTNEVASRIGVNYPASFTTPLATTIAIFKYTKLSLDQVFNTVAAVLLVLGALMIYSLLLSDVEGKTFEYGMLRAQGLRHYALIILLLTQAIYFSVPGILLGLLMGWVCFAIVAKFVYQFVVLPVNLTYYPISIVSGVLIGFCLPIIANIAPIQRALSRTLRDALDIYHQVKNETMVRIMKLEEVGIDLLQTLLAALAVGVGFTVYYLIPYAFTFYNYSMFFGILTAILLGMLFGLSMLAQAVQSLVEKAVLFLIVWGPDRKSLYNLVRKNLSSHSSRNAKTATMFTICLTFIIFTGCVFRLQGYNIQQLTRLGVGSDIAIIALSSKNAVPQAQVAAFLDNDMANNSASIVAGYTSVSFPMSHVLNVADTRLRTLANYPDVSVRLYGLSQNYLENTYLGFYDPTEESSSLSFPMVPVSDLTTSKKNVPDVVSSLYVNARKEVLPFDRAGANGVLSAPPAVQSLVRPLYNDSWYAGDDPVAIAIREFNNTYIYGNYTDAVISEAFRQSCGANTDTPFNLYIRFRGKLAMMSQLNLLAKAQSMVEMFPSFLFSAYGAMATRSPVLISLDQFSEIMQHIVTFSNDTSVVMPASIPMSKMLIRLKSTSASQLDREYVINGVKNFIKTDDIQVIDTQFLLAMTDTAVLLLDIFFYTVSGAAIALCFFMLWVSFSANIHENSWEFGVLRAIGLTSFQVTRIYIYEALVLIFSSVILGLLIGLGVAITLTLQFDLFTQLPFSFQFPYALFFSVLVISILIAIGVSYQSSKEYRNRQIASVLKGK